MLTFVDLSWRCSIICVIVVGAEIRTNGFDLVAEPEYEQCWAAMLTIVSLHAASSCTNQVDMIHEAKS